MRARRRLAVSTFRNQSGSRTLTHETGVNRG